MHSPVSNNEVLFARPSTFRVDEGCDGPLAGIHLGQAVSPSWDTHQHAQASLNLHLLLNSGRKPGMYADMQRPNKPLTIHGATKPTGLVSNLT